MLRKKAPPLSANTRSENLSADPAQPAILIVEDSETLRATLEQAVSSLQFRPLVFPSAEALLEHLKTHALSDFACLLTDLYLEGMTGLELAQLLAKRQPDLPIVLMSGNISENLPAFVQNLKFRIRLLEKPFRLHELNESLRSSLLAS